MSADIPTLPQAEVDTSYALPTGTTHNCTTAGQFSTALTNAALNDVIVLQAGTVFDGSFTLPNKASGSGWIYIISSALASLPALGTRVGPSDESNMPTIRTSTNNTAAITSANAAHHYRFVGIKFLNTATTQQGPICSFGAGATSNANLPDHIIFDRCYLTNTNSNGCRRGIWLNGEHMAVIDSYLNNFFDTLPADSQAINMFQGDGPFKIHNNYLQAASESFMSGGVLPGIDGSIPSDVTFTRNYVTKNQAWQGAGNKKIKNLLETKNVQRMLIEGNVFEHHWYLTGDGNDQHGHCITFTPRAESEGGGSDPAGNWSTVDDVTFRRNYVLDSPSGIIIEGEDTNDWSQIPNRVLVEDNLIWINTALPKKNSRNEAIRVSGFPPNPNITIRHNTILFSGTAGTQWGIFCYTYNGSGRVDELDINDNIFGLGDNGVQGGYVAQTEGTDTLDYTAVNWSFAKNVCVSQSSGDYPANNFFPATDAAVGFVNYQADGTGNYRLDSGSAYKNAATDGKDIGADIDAIEAAIAGEGGGSIIKQARQHYMMMEA